MGSVGWIGWMSVCVALAATSAVASAEVPAVPSGQPVTFQEMLWDRPGDGLVYRFRFVAPEIGEVGRAYEDVAGDMQYLCDTYALPRVTEIGPQPTRIVISLGQSQSAFGVSAQGITQFFEAYRIESGACILEFF